MAWDYLIRLEFEGCIKCKSGFVLLPFECSDLAPTPQKMDLMLMYMPCRINVIMIYNHAVSKTDLSLFPVHLHTHRGMDGFSLSSMRVFGVVGHHWGLIYGSRELIYEEPNRDLLSGIQ